MNELKAPWDKFPDYECGSLAWRMGAGEDFIDGWLASWRTMNPEGRKAFREKHPPPNAAWALWLDRSNNEVT